jgi:hypothetical protein
VVSAFVGRFAPLFWISVFGIFILAFWSTANTQDDSGILNRFIGLSGFANTNLSKDAKHRNYNGKAEHD